MSFTITPPNQITNFVGIADTTIRPTPRLSREQRLLAGFAEAQRGRVTAGKPTANG